MTLTLYLIYYQKGVRKLTVEQVSQSDIKLSKTITFILRHRPFAFNVRLDSRGYCSLTDLLTALTSQERFADVTLDDILHIVETCPKQRFEIKDGKIRARYGHSILDLELPTSHPPDILYHGTVTSSLDSIRQKGISEMNRKHVHLVEEQAKQFSIEAASRKKQQGRNNRVHLLPVNTVKALMLGVKFYNTDHGTWLSDAIPPEAIEWESTLTIEN